MSRDDCKYRIYAPVYSRLDKKSMASGVNSIIIPSLISSSFRNFDSIAYTPEPYAWIRVISDCLWFLVFGGAQVGLDSQGQFTGRSNVSRKPVEHSRLQFNLQCGGSSHRPKRC